jgi:hypothetical protein
MSRREEKSWPRVLTKPDARNDCAGEASSNLTDDRLTFALTLHSESKSVLEGNSPVWYEINMKALFGLPQTETQHFTIYLWFIE